MKAFWDFVYKDVPFKTSGELTFDDEPIFITDATLYETNEQQAIKNMLGISWHVIQVVGADSKKYSLYDCRIEEIEQRITPSHIIAKFSIRFRRAIQETNPDAQYNECSFTFIGIEELFPLESFSTEFSNNKEKLLFTKDMIAVPFTSIDADTSFKVQSVLNGIVSGDSVFNLNINQSKRIILNWADARGIEFIISKIVIIKQFFELMYGHELRIYDIRFWGCDYHDSGRLVFSDFNNVRYTNKNLNKVKYRGTYDDIITGLKGWIEKYDTIETGINIWLKQIYNSHVDQSDIILWNCQVIEFLGTCINSIKDDAQAIMDSRSRKDGSEPNLFAFLKAINTRYGFFEGLNETYYSDAKRVRNKITHNNPKNTVTERQMKNTEMIVKQWSVRLICKLVGLEKMSWSMCLIPIDS